jgi:ribosome-associated protein
MRPHVEKVEIGTDGIRLGQFLKLVGIAGTGGEAKAMLDAGIVTVNGEVDTRRGAQLAKGDTVAIDGQQFRLT